MSAQFLRMGTERIVGITSSHTRLFFGFALGSRKAAGFGHALQRRHGAAGGRDDLLPFGRIGKLDEFPRGVFVFRRAGHAVGVRMQNGGRDFAGGQRRNVPIEGGDLGRWASRGGCPDTCPVGHS